MKHTRKEFLYLSGAALGALAIPRIVDLGTARRIKRFGLQLYTIREVFEKDPKGTLKLLQGMGYQQLEGYERSTGLFWGMKNTGFKKYVNELGMDFISSHCDIDKDFEQKVADASAIGMKYLVAAWEGPGLSIEDYKHYAEKLNQKGKICKENGIAFAFHNHWFTFTKQGNEMPQDILMNYTDPALVDFELDIYWAASMDENAANWFKKYPNRFRLCHIKDRVKGSTKREDTCDLGKGSIDFSTILKAAKDNGMNYYFVEQEHYPDSTPMESAKADAEYMQHLKI